MDDKEFTLTKRIAKHGKQAVIVIPKILENSLKPGSIVEIKVRVRQEAQEAKKT